MNLKKLQLRNIFVAISLLITFKTANAAISPIPLGFDVNSVQFIFTKISATNYVPLGTCFIVNATTTRRPTFFHRLAIPLLVFFTYKAPITQNFPYWVTAKHVLFDENGQLHPNMYLRADNENGGVSYSYLNSDLTNGSLRILTPNEKAVDLVVFTVARLSNAVHQTNTTNNSTQSGPKMKFGWFDASLVMNDKMLAKYNVRVGEQMFFVGLFTPFYGANKNIPISRFGHLSMLPDEPIEIGKGNFQKLYLMETEAYGGNSGSPAFFSFDQGYFSTRKSEIKSGEPLFSDTEHTKILFAGAVNAYFPDFEQIKIQQANVNLFSQGNTGVASIVPASYLYDIIFSKAENKFRNEVWNMIAPSGYKKAKHEK